ncbi:MAG: HNH endonuclease [Pirellulales bacterium]
MFPYEPVVIVTPQRVADLLDDIYMDGQRRCEADLWEFLTPLYEWLGELLTPPLPLDWRERVEAYLAEQEPKGYTIEPENRWVLFEWIEEQIEDLGLLEPDGEDGAVARRPTMQQLAAAETVPDVQQMGEKSPPNPAPRKSPVVAPPKTSQDLDPGKYTPAAQEIIRFLGADWNDISVESINELRDSGRAIVQPTGAALNDLGVEAFVGLHRKDGGIDTAHLRFVSPWLWGGPHYELLGLKRGATPKQESEALKERQRIRHEDVMRVRGAINRAQSAIFAIVGGIEGIAEGAPLLGTLGVAAGAEEAGLAAKELATGKPQRAWSTQAIQAAFEAAGVDTETAAFLAEQGGLFVALGRATVDAAGTAHAVIETSTGYRIRLAFDPTTLSANGLGGAKIKVARLAPDGTEIKPIGGRYPINSKYAGKVMPASDLPAAIRKKYPNGVRFTSEGFPDFSPYAIKTVKVKGLTGDRRKDADLANSKAGLSKTPPDYTWHHHEDGVSMQLVPTDLHDAVRHTGGVGVTRHRGK